jgi:hypothetical protein
MTKQGPPFCAQPDPTGRPPGCDPGAPLAIQAQEVANLQGRCVRTEMAG